MKTVVILQEYVPQYRAPFFDLLVSKARARGMDVQIAYGEPGPSLSGRSDSANLDYGTTIRQHELNFFGRRLVMRRIGPTIRDADLVVLEQARRNLDAYRLLVKGSPARIVAFWGHGRDYTRPTRSFERRLSRWLTNRADWFFSYTPAGKDSVVANRFDRNRTTVVQNSIDTTHLKKLIAEVAPERLERFVKKCDLRGKTALFIGAFDTSKRLPFLIAAAERVHQLDPEFRLILAGNGAMHSQIMELSHKYAWLVVLNSVHGEEKALVMKASQILAVPGRVGLVAVDSFASALPVVTTDWQWHAPEFEYLVNDVNSVISPESIDDYAKSMHDVLRDTARLDRLRAACDVASQKYTIENMADNFVKGLEDAFKAGVK